MSHTRSSIRRAVPALLAAAALCAALPAQSQGAPSDSVLRGFQRSGDYILMVNGQADAKAEIYINQGIPAYLILPTAVPSPILLTPRAGTVETVQLMKVARQKDGTVDILADAALRPQGKFKLTADRVEFTSEGKKVSLNPKPPLLGTKNAAALKQHSPEYVRGAQAYTPNAQSMAALKKQAQPVRVVVFFGTWCPHCKEHLPHLLRVEDELKGGKFQFEYRGIPRDFKDAEVQRLKVSEVPTAVVYVGGREVGRIIRNDWTTPETALSLLLGRAAKAGK